MAGRWSRGVAPLWASQSPGRHARVPLKGSRVPRRVGREARRFEQEDYGDSEEEEDFEYIEEELAYLKRRMSVLELQLQLDDLEQQYQMCREKMMDGHESKGRSRGCPRGDQGAVQGPVQVQSRGRSRSFPGGDRGAVRGQSRERSRGCPGAVQGLSRGGQTEFIVDEAPKRNEKRDEQVVLNGVAALLKDGVKKINMEPDEGDLVEMKPHELSFDPEMESQPIWDAEVDLNFSPYEYSEDDGLNVDYQVELTKLEDEGIIWDDEPIDEQWELDEDLHWSEDVSKLVESSEEDLFEDKSQVFSTESTMQSRSTRGEEVYPFDDDIEWVEDERRQDPSPKDTFTHLPYEDEQPYILEFEEPETEVWGVTPQEIDIFSSSVQRGTPRGSAQEVVVSELYKDEDLIYGSGEDVLVAMYEECGGLPKVKMKRYERYGEERVADKWDVEIEDPVSLRTNSSQPGEIDAGATDNQLGGTRRTGPGGVLVDKARGRRRSQPRVAGGTPGARVAGGTQGQGKGSPGLRGWTEGNSRRAVFSSFPSASGQSDHGPKDYHEEEGEAPIAEHGAGTLVKTTSEEEHEPDGKELNEDRNFINMLTWT